MGESTLYRIHGLTIESELELPEALLAQHAAVPQVRIRIGHVAPGGLAGAGGHQLGPFAWAAPATVWLQVPGVARFLVSGGEEIVVDPHPGTDQDSVRLFLLGSALGAVCFQQGMMVLHGNAIGVGDGCLVCVGPPGSGKSTLAAGFMRMGCRVLADDLVPFDEECRALPGMPRLKLRSDAADRLAISTEGLPRVRPGVAKFQVPLGDAFQREPAPIRWIYVLTRWPEGFRVEPVSGMDRLAPLREHTYRLRFIDGLGLHAQHFRLCGRLASRSRLSVVRLSTAAMGPSEVVDRLLADTGSSR